MCLKPVQINRINVLTHASRRDVVPCGKCLECLRRKQNDYAFISKRQALESGNIVFLTLTFRNDSIPMAAVYEVFNTESGAVIDRSRPVFVRDEFVDDVRREYYASSPVSGWQLEVPCHYAYPLEEESDLIKEYTYSPGIFVHLVRDPRNVYQKVTHRSVNDGYQVRCLVTPSLCRELVQLAIKSYREDYKKQYGVRPKFKYFEVGEYGPNTSRPHVHCLFYGISVQELSLFINRWNKEYGRVDVEEVRPRSGDSIEAAYEKVSRYLAKYLCKGDFEAEFVKSGYVEKPRRVSSRRLGTENLESLRAYVLGFDLFGEYDPDRPPREVLDDSSLDILLEREYVTRYDMSGKLIKERIPKVILNYVRSKTFSLSQEDRRRLGFSPVGKASFVLRLSHQRSLLSRKLSSRKKARSDFEYESDVLRASSGSSLRPSSVAFRVAFASLQAPLEKARFSSAALFASRLQATYQQSLY